MFIFPKLSAANGSGGTFDGDDPWCIVLHTTEIASDPENWIPNWKYPSHVVADPKRRKVFQCLSLAEAGKSLWNEPGGVETNYRRCIQIEININSPHTGTTDPLTEDDYRWLGEEIIRPIVEAIGMMGGSVNLDQVRPAWDTRASYGLDASQRMTFAEWNAFNGVCCHAEVPENDHWDVGCIDRHKLANYAKYGTDEDMLTDTDREMLATIYEAIRDNRLAGVVVSSLDNRFNNILAAVQTDVVRTELEQFTDSELLAELANRLK